MRSNIKNQTPDHFYETWSFHSSSHLSKWLFHPSRFSGLNNLGLFLTLLFFWHIICQQRWLVLSSKYIQNISKFSLPLPLQAGTTFYLVPPNWSSCFCPSHHIAFSQNMSYNYHVTFLLQIFQWFPISHRVRVKGINH